MIQEGWTLNGAGLDSTEVTILQSLKTVDGLNKQKWLALAAYYKRSGKLNKCEIAYLGARYTDISDKDLMREWLAVYTLNRGGIKSKEALLKSANMINEGLFEVVTSDARVLHEVQHLIFALEKPEERA